METFNSSLIIIFLMTEKTERVPCTPGD